jgi:hypothetical protein
MYHLSSHVQELMRVQAIPMNSNKGNSPIIDPPTNPHSLHVVGYNPFSLCLIHKEDLCPAESGDYNNDDDLYYIIK